MPNARAQVVEGRNRVATIEGQIWEMREAYELKLDNVSVQLKATQVGGRRPAGT